MSYLLLMIVTVVVAVGITRAMSKPNNFGAEALRRTATELGGIDATTARTIRVVTVVTGMPFTALDEINAETDELKSTALELYNQAEVLRTQANNLDNQADEATTKATKNDELLASFTV